VTLRFAAVIALTALTGLGAAFALQNESTTAPAAEGAETAAPATPTVAGEPDRKAQGGEAKAPALTRGTVTPMKDRVAVLGLLNKRNGLWRDIKLRPGQAVRAGDVIVRLRACETTAPWESQKLTGAFVQTDVRGSDGAWRRVFSGWLFKESPSLNVVEHAIYDVWPKSCEMRYPDIGPETVSVGSVGTNRSSAKKSAEQGDAEPPAPIPSAESSNPT
jgi:hypothetical protein